MTSGSLVDLDPAPEPERRWPYYVGWAAGAAILGAVLLSLVPTAYSGAATVVAPAATASPAATVAPPSRGPQATPLRVAPGPAGPARP
jgi:hypothetical protein